MTGEEPEDIPPFASDAGRRTRSPEAGRVDGRKAGASPTLARRRVIRRALVLADTIAFVAAFAIAEWVAGARAGDVLLVLPVVATCLAAMAGYRLYDRDRLRTGHSTADEFVN